MITAGSYKTRLALLNLHVATSLVSDLNNVDRPLGAADTPQTTEVAIKPEEHDGYPLPAKPVDR